VLVTALWSAHSGHRPHRYRVRTESICREHACQFARDGQHCQVGAGGRPVFPGSERVVRVRSRVMRAKTSGHRRTESRRVARRHIPSRDYCPVRHADRVANTGHPRLSAGKRAAEWV